MQSTSSTNFTRVIPFSRHALFRHRALVLLAVGWLAVLPAETQARRASAANACCANMKQIEGAIATWALEEKKATNAVPQPAELFGVDRYIREAPSCPLGGEYKLNLVGEHVECSIHGTIVALNRVEKTQAQTKAQHWAIVILLLLGLGGGALSMPVTASSAKWQEWVAVCMPVLMAVATFYLFRGRFTFVSSEFVFLLFLLTVGLSVRAIFLPRLGQRMVGWVIGLTWLFFYAVSQLTHRCG